MSEIEKIASMHLGKAGDGSIVKPYVTPDEIDASLLVGIPRSLNRQDYGIDGNSLFVGVDVWNAYEVSFLLDNNVPVNGVVSIIYPAHSPNIVESKSLKLYLNSFNMVKMGSSRENATTLFCSRVSRDLTDVLKLNENAEDYPIVVRFNPCIMPHTVSLVDNPTKYYTLELQIGICLPNNIYDKAKDTLKVVSLDNDTKKLTEKNPFSPRTGGDMLHSACLRSNCRVTNQPDWGDIYIMYNGPNLVDRASMLEFIVSLRKENHFHEEICELVYKRLSDALCPNDLLVACLYTRRGGIDINPVRASSWKIFDDYINLGKQFTVFAKTARQ